jgi:type II secretory ATPase GspE/PulE/Tfp pilus assembly ATPase PilB-like protein
VVVRVLDPSRVPKGLDQLGMEPDTREALQEAITRPTGIVLLTGPTGSGKTTTLYAALRRVATLEKNVVTVEDPIEYFLDTVNQTQVNPRAGLTFATGLRSILRQDPDVIMVGEIRDRETAEIAIQASMTGHLVFSTLHTNDAASALARLVDMGVEPFLAASAVTGILGQRLVRVVCPGCAEPCAPAPETLARLGADTRIAPGTLRRGRGCPRCRETGYQGRTGIFELLQMNPEIEDLVCGKARASAIRARAAAGGMRTLRRDGLRKAEGGVTTLEEVLRVT